MTHEVNLEDLGFAEEFRGKLAVLDFASKVLHGDDEHRAWLLHAAKCYAAGMPLPPPNVKRRVRHRKRGWTYEVLGQGMVQTGVPLYDDASVVVYRGEKDGRLWVRPVGEFEDGRFEELP